MLSLTIYGVTSVSLRRIAVIIASHPRHGSLASLFPGELAGAEYRGLGNTVTITSDRDRCKANDETFNFTYSTSRQSHYYY